MNRTRDTARRGHAPRNTVTKNAGIRKQPQPKDKATSGPSGQRIRPSWYKNPKFSDIMIKYGPDGSLQFDGHRLILSNISEWFELSSNAGFIEANACVITLQDDVPEALDALFEYCYRGDYTVTPTGESVLSHLKDLFMHEANVMVTADKYMADDLVALATGRIADTLFEVFQLGVYDVKTKTALFKFVVEHVYLHPESFGLEEPAPETTTQQPNVETEHVGKRPKNIAPSRRDADIDHISAVLNGGFIDPKTVSAPDHDADAYSLATSPRQSPIMLFDLADEADTDTDDFDPEDFDANSDRKIAHHPFDRLRQIVITAAIDVWRRNENYLGRRHLSVLVKQIPGFGVDLIVAALASEDMVKKPNLDEAENSALMGIPRGS